MRIGSGGYSNRGGRRDRNKDENGPLGLGFRGLLTPVDWPNGLAQDLIPPLFFLFFFFFFCNLFFEHTRLRWTLVSKCELDPTRLFHDG